MAVLGDTPPSSWEFPPVVDGWLADGLRAWAMNPNVDIDIRTLGCGVVLVEGQSGGLGGFGGFHGCVSEFVCLRCIAPIDCGFMI